MSRRARNKPRLAFVVVAALAATGCGHTKTSAPRAPELLRVAGDSGTSYHSGPGVHGNYAVGTNELSNHGKRSIVIETVALRWDRSPGLSRGRMLGSILRGPNGTGMLGEASEWPLRHEIARDARRSIPGAQLAPGEWGQVVVGLRAPGRGTAHLRGIDISYAVAGERRLRHLATDVWYCYRQSAMQCRKHAQMR